MKQFFEYLYVVVTFVVSCILFFAILFLIATSMPGQSFPPSYQLFFCCGLLYPVIVIISFFIVIMRLIKKRKVGILPVIPIIYFFAYIAFFVMMIILYALIDN